MEGEGEPVLQTADIVSAVLTRWSAAQRGGDKAGQVAVVLELVELSQDDGMLDAMCQVRHQLLCCQFRHQLLCANTGTRHTSATRQ
ncbi:hypothetical protein HaLaN_04641 [Haematococcus lacustris]|uniref:Uncharacterized protein n=1 Tax=Haematococcus lacustris TaxID=44745 RepID=A0A699YH41_HAELA|nr:hypothetical protein HaLaN_04641 [Haematococcus lacustris]